MEATHVHQQAAQLHWSHSNGPRVFGALRTSSCVDQKCEVLRLPVQFLLRLNIYYITNYCSNCITVMISISNLTLKVRYNIIIWFFFLLTHYPLSGWIVFWIKSAFIPMETFSTWIMFTWEHFVRCRKPWCIRLFAHLHPSHLFILEIFAEAKTIVYFIFRPFRCL